MHEVAKYKLQLQMIRGAVKIELEKRRAECTSAGEGSPAHPRPAQRDADDRIAALEARVADMERRERRAWDTNEAHEERDTAPEATMRLEPVWNREEGWSHRHEGALDEHSLEAPYYARDWEYTAFPYRQHRRRQSLGAIPWAERQPGPLHTARSLLQARSRTPSPRPQRRVVSPQASYTRTPTSGAAARLEAVLRPFARAPRPPL